MRKLLSAAGVSVLAVVLVAVGVDTGAAIYAEYQLSRHLRSAAGLPFDPWVAILGFPFVPQALGHHYRELEIKAGGVDHPVVGKVTLEATMHDVGLTQASWLVRPDADLPVGKLESRIIIDSRHLGGFIGVRDLTVEAPAADTNDATGGTTESGISGSNGLIFTGTPTRAGLDKPVSITVDLSVAGPDQTTLVFTRTKYKAKNLALKLAQSGFKATSLQGNLSQNKRQQALDGFKDGTFNILVATDIAARGIDVTGISHVIN
ncbi:MAG: LmeA family phospholipid-binding protein, partial [Actinomycetes bacterium]